MKAGSPEVGAQDDGITGRLTLRFLLVGGANTVAGYLLFLLLAQFSKSDVLTVLLAYIAHFAITPIAFLLYRKLVFRHTGPAGSAFIKFQLGYALPLVLNGPLLFLALKLLDGNAAFAQALVLGLLATISLIVNRYLVFRPPT